MSRLTHAQLLDIDTLLQLEDVGRNQEKETIAAFQQAIEFGKTTLAEYHLEGGNAAILGKNQSWLIDQVLVHAWQRFFPQNQMTNDPTLIAAGGYGRQELNLESDIDLLILLPDKNAKKLLETLASFIRFCWDIGLKVGHSAQTLKQCVDLCRKDISVITNMMETRLVFGHKERFNQLQSNLRGSNIWPADQYFTNKLQEQESRHLHFGDTAYNLEPNIKESPGGLRDLHMISWVANRYFGTSDFAELVDHQFLTEAEYRVLIKGRDFLWRLRNGLHVLAGRSEDRLLFDFQRDLAQQLGFKDKPNNLAVEQMMQRYYRIVKEIQLLNELSLQHFQEAILQNKKPRPRRINDRFNKVGQFLEISKSNVFEKRPNAILELFHVMQRNPELTGVRASTIRQLRNNLYRIDKDYRNHPDNLEMFLNIFKYQDGLTHALRRMNAYDVLGSFFPEFGKVVGQMQHDLFHIFTVDAHSLFVVGNIRRLMMDKYKDEFPVLRNIISQLNRRERLYLAALCHDIGKGSGKDHSIVGEKIARTLCNRLGLEEYDANFVAWLVRHHLNMSWIAQREDTSDPRVIDRFAEIVGDQEHLDNLYLLTVADIRGISHKVWNEWKGQLLSNLYTATSRRLRSGISGAQAISQRIEDRKRAIAKNIGNSIPGEALQEIWGQMDQAFFLRNGPETSAWLAQKFYHARIQTLPLVAVRYRPEIRAQQILVIAPESEKLLSQSTAALDYIGLSIMDARIHRTRSRLAILLFITAPAVSGTPSKNTLDHEIQKIREFMLSPRDSYTPRDKSLPRAHKQFNVPTTISFSDINTPGHTTMEVVSQDRPGLLYHVSQALLDCKIRLLSAKISTVGEKAEDTFFIADRDGQPVTSKKFRADIEKKIKKYLKEPLIKK